MHETAVVLGWLLLGQVSFTAPQSPDAQGQPPAALQDAAAAESTPMENRDPLEMTPPEIVAEALALPPESRLTGQPFTLLRGLSATPDRRGQLDVAHAYWQLVEAVAVYRFCIDYDGQIRELQGTAMEAAALRAAGASSAASLREAEVRAIAAQHDLAALVLLAPDAALPLPADWPHVGPYRTHFQELFSTRAVPTRAKLMDRILPVRYQAIDERASAVRAAQKAVRAAVDRREDLSVDLARLRQLLHQRQEFVASVCRYNDEIADYALSVASPGTSVQGLVRMLIRPASDAAVQPAEYRELAPTPARRSEKGGPIPSGRSLQGGANTPTPAVRRELPGDSDEPGRDPVPGWVPSGTRSPGSATGGAGPDGVVKPDVVPPDGEAKSTESARSTEATKPTGSTSISDRPVVPVEAPTTTTVQRPLGEVAANETPGEESPRYRALADATPAGRARQLTGALHGGQTLTEGIGDRMRLEECLRSQALGDRKGLIGAYWHARQAAAEYQVFVQRALWLEGLRPSESDESSRLRLRSAQSASKAVMHEAHAALIEAQFELARYVGRVPAPVWPMPSTAPHSGRYLLKLDVQPRRLVESWPLRRVAAMIPGLAESVRQHATAVVEADGVRADATASYRTGGPSMEQAIEGIDRQTDETRAFLQALTDYNVAIAEYALTVLPPQTPSNRLVGALVVVE